MRALSFLSCVAALVLVVAVPGITLARGIAPVQTDMPEDYAFDTAPYMTGDKSAEAAEKEGQALAEADLKAKRYRVLVYGLGAYDPNRSAYLLETYQVYTVPIAGCVVTEALLGVAKGYNETMAAGLKKLHGKDIFAEAEKQAATAHAD